MRGATSFGRNLWTGRPAPRTVTAFGMFGVLATLSLAATPAVAQQPDRGFVTPWSSSKGADAVAQCIGRGWSAIGVPVNIVTTSFGYSVVAQPSSTVVIAMAEISSPTATAPTQVNFATSTPYPPADFLAAAKNCL